MSDRFDLAVIGGGPAGTSAAITAARIGHRVLLLERGSFPRQKVCGEFVSSESLGLLERLLGSNHQWTSTPIKISRARIFFDGRVREMKVQPEANSIPRFVMDHALWETAKHAGVEALENATVNEIGGDGPFGIATANGHFAAKAVINASGRWSSLTGSLHVPRLGASVGLKQHFHEADPPISVDLYFFPGGYCGVQPVGANEINVSAMVSPRVAKELETVFALEPSLKKRSAGWKPKTELVSTYPLIHGKPIPVQPRRDILNVGDAAGFIDPFVGDGISMALHSGTMAAEAVSKSLAGSCSLGEAALDYRAAYEERLLPAFRNAARLRKLVASPTLRGLALALFSIPAISRLAVRKTRARTG